MYNSNIDYLKRFLKGNDLENGIKKLKMGIPVQYIVGNVDFFGNIIKVNNSVLIPRFETELLVEKTINYINNYFNKKVSVVDLGTGSGCIAIALKKEIDCEVDAVDISIDALNVARDNAKNNNISINFILGNMLNNLDKKYDVIISNPPYIRYDEKIMDIVKNNEPKIALYADDNGLYFYKDILKNAKKNLKRKSIIAFEIGMNQGNDIKEYASLYFPNSKILIEKDYNDRDRFIFIISE